jgi:glycosyltransferase involved in cell wall biosynthesis
VPNGIDIERYEFSESLRDKLRGQYKISKSTSIWLTIGRLEEVKNQEFLIDLLKNHFIDSNEILFIIGNGSLHDNLQNQINNSSLSNRVYLLPARDDVNEYYSMADFFVLPSLFEGVPTVGIEAQANGLKCIFSDRVAKEVAVSENSLFLPLDQDIWAKELKKKPKGIKYRNNLQDESIQAYNIKMTVKKLEEIYDI